MRDAETELLEARVAAFALVIAADGRIDHVELAWAPTAFGGSASAARPLLERVAARLREGGAAERADQLAKVRVFAGDRAAASQILATARAAVVADGRVDPREDHVLAELARQLGVAEA